MGSETHTLRASVWVGKKGCTDGILDEIRTQLDARGVVKVKWLRDTDIDPREIAARTGSVLIDTRGRTIVLAKRKRP